MPRNYAPMAKVRALYGKRLLGEDYEALLQKKTVGEVAAYLKRETAYAGLLAEVREDLVHRGQLESLIRRRKLDITLSLAKYSYSNNTFMRLFLMQAETEQLLGVLRVLGSPGINSLVASFPAYLARFLSFDLYALAGVRTFEELLEVLEHTPYREVLLPLAPQKAAAADVTACETALLTAYYRRALALVNARYSGEDRRTLRELILRRADLYNLTVIYRLKRYFAADPHRISACLIILGEKTAVGRHTYDSLLASSDAATVLVRLRNIPMLQKYLEDKDQDIDLVMTRYLQAASRKTFRFSQIPAVVLLCYMTLLEIEIENLTNIIEGIRYSRPAGEIRGLLVY